MVNSPTNQNGIPLALTHSHVLLIIQGVHPKRATPMLWSNTGGSFVGGRGGQVRATSSLRKIERKETQKGPKGLEDWKRKVLSCNVKTSTSSPGKCCHETANLRPYLDLIASMRIAARHG